MPEYTVSVVIGVIVVVAMELLWLKTGIFKTVRYWASMVIVLGFQVLVDGLLTRGSTPVVGYDDSLNSGIRFPWDIPIEDFAFGFALVTAVLLVWVRLTRQR